MLLKTKLERCLFILFVGGIIFYMLPAIIAQRRRAAHETAIMLVNLLFGWTVLGWIAALIWAVSEQTLPPAIDE